MESLRIRFLGWVLYVLEKVNELFSIRGLLFTSMLFIILFPNKNVKFCDIGLDLYFKVKIEFLCLQLFDGHNGSAAAIYAKENLLNNVLAAIPPDLNRDEWIAALPRALVAGFVKTDKDFQEKGEHIPV